MCGQFDDVSAAGGQDSLSTWSIRTQCGSLSYEVFYVLCSSQIVQQDLKRLQGCCHLHLPFATSALTSQYIPAFSFQRSFPSTLTSQPPHPTKWPHIKDSSMSVSTTQTETEIKIAHLNRRSDEM